MVSKKHTVLKSSYNLRPRPTRNKSPPRTLRPHTRTQYIPPYLTPDIIFAILVYLPADILYNVARYVCREWYNIISSPKFIDAHLGNTEQGLFINQDGGFYVTYVEIEKNNALRKVDLAFSRNNPHYGMSCCNGLVYLCDVNIRHVVNFITKEVITLSPPPNFFRSNVQFHVMGYTRSRKYKLVEFYTIRNKNCQIALVAGILTLGVDTEWRSLFQLDEGAEIENFCISDFVYRKPIVTTQGILHVIHSKLPLVFNLDLETETFHVRAIPECSKINRTYMGTRRSLCFMDCLGKFSWELWLLKDAEAGEWTKQVVDLRDEKEMLMRYFLPHGYVLVPVGLLKDGEIVVFNVTYEGGYLGIHSRNCVTYNVKTEDLNTFYLDYGDICELDKVFMYNPHVKSLVSLKVGEN